MTDFLVKKFIKNSEDIENTDVRRSYGTLSSVIGVGCNIILFIVKYIMGTLSGSISIISDAFNNLSDSGGCIVTFFGYKMAAKPADKDHPFGHGRVEYLTSLILSAIIVIVGFELFKSSAYKIIHPERVNFSVIVLVSLILSICVKLWLSVFNRKLGEKINSPVMAATAEDSKNDVIATSATIISLVASIFTDFPVDGAMGIVVSIFILKAGLEIIKDTVDELIGKPVSAEIIDKIGECILSYDKIIDIHDLMIHNYGPGNMIGSCHIEVRSDESLVAVHEIADCIEREISDKLGIIMTLHLDPIETDNENVNSCKNMINEIISSINDELSIHDFRVVSGENHTNLIFDMTVPYECKMKNDDIKKCIDEKLKSADNNYFTVINFEREYYCKRKAHQKNCS